MRLSQKVDPVLSTVCEKSDVDDRLAWKSITTVVLVNPASRRQPREAKNVETEVDLFFHWKLILKFRMFLESCLAVWRCQEIVVEDMEH